jgi:hypothetical protein
MVAVILQRFASGLQFEARRDLAERNDVVRAALI